MMALCHAKTQAIAEVEIVQVLALNNGGGGRCRPSETSPSRNRQKSGIASGKLDLAQASFPSARADGDIIPNRTPCRTDPLVSYFRTGVSPVPLPGSRASVPVSVPVPAKRRFRWAFWVVPSTARKQASFGVVPYSVPLTLTVPYDRTVNTAKRYGAEHGTLANHLYLAQRQTAAENTFFYLKASKSQGKIFWSPLGIIRPNLVGPVNPPYCRLTQESMLLGLGRSSVPVDLCHRGLDDTLRGIIELVHAVKR